MNFCIMFRIKPNTETAKRLDLPNLPDYDIEDIDGSIHNMPAVAMLLLIEGLLDNPDVSGFTVCPATEHTTGNTSHEMRH